MAGMHSKHDTGSAPILDQTVLPEDHSLQLECPALSHSNCVILRVRAEPTDCCNGMSESLNLGKPAGCPLRGDFRRHSRVDAAPRRETSRFLRAEGGGRGLEPPRASKSPSLSNLASIIYRIPAPWKLWAYSNNPRPYSPGILVPDHTPAILDLRTSSGSSQESEVHGRIESSRCFGGNSPEP